MSLFQMWYLLFPGSILKVGAVTDDHAGNYTCEPSNASPSSVQVHVVQGK